MKTFALMSLAGAALMLSACSFAPQWSKPEMPVPEAFRSNNLHGSTMADLPWQQVLHDSNLQALLTDVFNSNRSLEAMMHNVESARHAVTVATAPLFPWAGYGGSVSKGMNSSGGAGIAKMYDTTSTPGSAQLSASWELDLWGKTRNGITAADAEAMAAEEQFNNLRISLLRQVANGYLQLIMLDEQLKIQHDAVESFRETLELFGHMQENGVASGLETASAQAALSAAEAQIPTLEAQIAELENTLSTLAGRMPGHIRRSGSLAAFANASHVAAGIPADVMARRPDIRAAEQKLRAANAEIGVAIASYFPSISLTGAMGFASSDLTQAVRGKRTGWGIGANLTGPIFQGGMLVANHQIKKEAFLAAKADYENTVLNAMSEISTTLVKRAKLKETIANQEAAVAAGQESVKLSKDRFTGGAASYYEVLTAQRELFPAQLQLAAYRFQYASCIPTLYTQLGGGWGK